MQPTAEPARPHPARSDDLTRTGAVWVTGTGAFLLVVAAAIFVAVRWDQLPEGLKLAALGGLSASALLAGRKLRRRLPATGAVIYHLGAFLLPIVAAAVTLRFDGDWRVLLLVEGVVGAVAFTVLERVECSVVLRAAAAVAVVVAALGLGATTPVPPLAVVAVAAVLAATTRRRRLARFWALTAGLAPAVALAAPWLAEPRILEDLALTGPNGQWGAALSGLVAAGVLLVDARATRELALLAAALVSCALGLANAWYDIAPPAHLGWLAAATVFLAAELAAWLLASDDFLDRPARVVAVGAEILAGVVIAPFALAVLLVPDPTVAGIGVGEPSVVVAAITALGAWLLADVRRRAPDRTPDGIALLVGSGRASVTFALTATIAAGVAFGTASSTATAIALVTTTVLLVLSGRPYGHLLGSWCATVAVVLAAPDVVLTCAMAGIGAVALSAAAVARAHGLPGLRKVTPTRFPYMTVADADAAAAATWAVAATSLVPLAFAVAYMDRDVDELVWFGTWIAGCWFVALVLDRARTVAPTRHLGALSRFAAIGIVPFALDASAADGAIVAAAIAVLSSFDAVRRREPIDALAGSIAGPIAIAAGAVALDLGTDTASIAVALSALGAAAATVVLPRRWHAAWVTGAAWAAAIAVPMAATDASAFASVLLVLGGALLVVAVERRSGAIGAAGAIVTCLGVWAHLDVAEVDATDAYVAPVSAALLVAGWFASRRNGVSSWVAYGPAIVLLAGASLAERFAGGPAVHALVAGAVGTVAVIAGGGRRLAAPLLIGTGVLVAVVVSETLAYTATLPTWAWLALAGAVLVGAGVAMERTEVSPLQTGRRVVDVLRDTFA